ncbi:hypothetical protein AYO45_05015 [Gammaproteobacteria bacterium SCGC AG-212-F23]|nr:hypothetical protein AYO45_05015 [Gammaproteobacteria bacterium SCGC AG-212-F23]
MKYLLAALIIVVVCFYFFYPEKKEIRSIFPLEHYSQTISDWIKPTDKNYDIPLLAKEQQKTAMDHFYQRFMGELSPWSETHIKKIIDDNILKSQEELIHLFSNKNKPENEINYAENDRPYSDVWLNAITENMNLSQLQHLKYQANQRAMMVNNADARSLPTMDPAFYSEKIPGQGYPFDNLQVSAVWAGTPVYVLGETRDHAWKLIITPDFVAWVKAETLVMADKHFIQQWQSAGKKQLTAINKTNTSMVDARGNFYFSAYVGSVFPAVNASTLLIPIVSNHHAAIAIIKTENATLMPQTITPHHIADIMSILIGRPYGWGNSYFYNDCSAELKNLYTPFGIWLPRSSVDQIRAGHVINLDTLSTKERLNYLKEHGHPLMTLVYIGEHIFLYVGTIANPNSEKHEAVLLSYQNVWGLKPHPPTRRAIIGQAVLFPLLETYPEDKTLASFAARKEFQVIFLDIAPP